MAHRSRLYPTIEQTSILLRHCADARFVWNLALEQANWYRPHWGPTPSGLARMRQLAEARQTFPWLAEGSSSIQQGALRDFDQALKNWWGGTHRRPTWRKRGINEGFVVRDLIVIRLSRKWASINVPKCGPVRFRLTRPIPDGVKSARVTLDPAGRWHLSFPAPQPIVERSPTGAVVGIDLGVVSTITMSGGTRLSTPILSSAERSRLRRLQRKFARRRKGSNRRECVKLRIAKLRARETDRRKDWVEKTSTALIVDHDVVVFEDLKVKWMVRSAKGTVKVPGRNVAQKRGLNRSISEQGWAMLVKRTEEKAATCGVQVARVDPRYTSQRCPCGHVSAENRKSQAEFRCVACGYEAHADVNAALNILAAGLAVIGRGGTGAVGPPVEASTTRLGLREPASEGNPRLSGRRGRHGP